jgi:hypothetical protein
MKKSAREGEKVTGDGSQQQHTHTVLFFVVVLAKKTLIQFLYSYHTNGHQQKKRRSSTNTCKMLISVQMAEIDEGSRLVNA